MLVARFGYIDKHGGCFPSDSLETTEARKNLLLTSKPFHGIRIPVLRTVVRVGVFLESAGAKIFKAPKLIVETLATNKAIGFRVKLLCRAIVNRYGGELLMIQTFPEMVITPEFGTHLGTIEFQYPLFSAPRIAHCMIHTISAETSGKQELTILVNA